MSNLQGTWLILEGTSPTAKREGLLRGWRRGAWGWELSLVREYRKTIQKKKKEVRWARFKYERTMLSARRYLTTEELKGLRKSETGRELRSRGCRPRTRGCSAALVKGSGWVYDPESFKNNQRVGSAHDKGES